MEKSRVEAKTRKTRSDKKFHVNPPFDQDTYRKIDMLAFACHMPKTQLLIEMVEICLRNESFISYIQDRYNKDDNRRVIPVHDPEGIHFIFKSKY